LSAGELIASFLSAMMVTVAYIVTPSTKPRPPADAEVFVVADVAALDGVAAKVGIGGSFVLDVGDGFDGYLELLSVKYLSRVVVVLGSEARARDAFRAGAADVLVGDEVLAAGALSRLGRGAAGSRFAQLLDLAWQGAPIGMALMDAETGTVLLNPVEVARVPQKGDTRSHDPSEWPTLRNARGAVFAFEELPLSRAARGESVEGERIHWSAPGDAEGRHLGVSARPLVDGRGALRGGVVVSRDETAQVLAERHGLGAALQAEAFAKSTPDVLLTLDEGGTILTVNPAVRDMLGHDPLGLVGKRIHALIPKDLHAAHDEGFARYLATSKKRISWSRIALPALHAVGHLVPVEVSFSEYVLAGKRYFTGTLRDATEARRTETRRAMESSRLTALVRNLQAGVLVEDEAGRVVLTNDAFATALCPEVEHGASGAELHVHMSTRMAEPARFLERIEEVLGARELVVHEPIELRDGTFYERDFIPIFVDGEYRGQLWSYVDVTERRRSAATISGLHHELESRAVLVDTVSRELEAFSYSVSHDLRAPLRSIHGFAGALAEDYAAALDATAKGYLDRIMAGATRLGDLIDDLIELSRISRTRLVRGPVDLTAMARTIAAEIAVAPENVGRSVEVRIADGMVAEGDGSLVRALLTSLLDNAFKYTRAVPLARIEMFTETRGEETLFVVKDNGAGFDMAHAARLFSAFERLHARSDFEGTGIGLAAAHRVVTKHGGRIFADAIPGQGASFSFTLRGVRKAGAS